MKGKNAQVEYKAQIKDIVVALPAKMLDFGFPDIRN